MVWTFRGAVALALAVGAGAFGAHGLKARLSPEALGWWQTAADYHFFHGLGLLAIDRVPGKAAQVAGWLLLAGLVLFSGSLYTMALTDLRWLGAITPIGGTSWVAAWVALAVAARRAHG